MAGKMERGISGEVVSERERLIDDLLLLLPVLSRGLGGPWPKKSREMEEVTGCAVTGDFPGGISPGHVQVLISLSGGARSVGAIAEELGVSSPAITQLVDRLVDHGMVERRHAERDRRVVLVDFVPEMKEVARRITHAYKSHLEDLVKEMTDEEMRAFLKGIRLLADEAGNLESSIKQASR